MIPWTTIALCAAGLILALAVIWGAIWISRKWGQSEVRQAIAEDEAERRAQDAEIASKPMSRSPLTGPGGLFDK
jgi:hypothetical protein